jgi:uncharacterized membrane protein YkvA (DUF1232 family)
VAWPFVIMFCFCFETEKGRSGNRIGPIKKKTPFTFEEARIKAESYAGEEKKLLSLVEKATRKFEQYYELLLAPWESLQTFLRLLRASFTGKFSAPSEALLMILTAVVYFACPFDLLPDSIPVLGFVDDAAVITFVPGQILT